MLINNNLNDSIHDHFPFSDQKGNHRPAINSHLVQQLVEKAKPITSADIVRIVKDHHLFLKHGGSGGTWKTILIQGLILGIYDGPEVKHGKQASFEHRTFEANPDMSNLALPFSNWCGTVAGRLTAVNIELSHALLTDAYLVQANFKQARLCNVDFSRANLQGADFREADCAGADFENCDLRNADFRDARLIGAKFPGANLSGVKY